MKFIVEMNIILAITIMILPKLHQSLSSSSLSSSADSKASSTSIDKKQEQGQQSSMTAATAVGNVRKQMSCYVCSTMDYENPQENSCKSMPKLTRQATGPLHQQPGGSASHHPSSMSFAHQPTTLSTTTTTTTTTTSTTPTSTYPQTAAALDGSDLYSPTSQSMVSLTTTYEDATQFDPTTTATTTTIPMTNSDQHNQLSLSDKNNSKSLSYQQQQQQLQISSMSASGGNFPNQMMHLLPYNAPVRKRSCSEDENFCSIVSVVRINFVNDSLVQRFWAMERNCSKSCNTGCMLIGERVRLRVCSQCCRTPDCNIGSGAITLHKRFQNNYFYYEHNNLLILLISLILLKLNCYH